MASFYVSPTGSGSGDGSSIANAVAIGDLPALVSSAGPGATIYLIADQGPYVVTAPIVLASGGTAGAPITITGVDSAGNPMAAAFVGDRADPYDPAGSSGSEVFRLLTGADNLVFSNLTFDNVGNGAFRVGGDIANLTIEHVAATNLDRFFENVASGTSTTATISGLTITDVTIHGFSQDAIRIQYDSHDVLIQDVYGDSEFQDGQGFAEGIHILGTAHDITVERVTMGNARTTEDSYWNGDGFVSEAGAYNIAFIDTLAFGNADAGYDIKSSSTTLTGAVAEGNNRNFRIWATDTVLTDVVSIDPHHSGGTASMSSFWFGKNAQATIVNPTVSDSGSTLVFDLPNASSIANVTGLTLFAGANTQLARTASSSKLNIDAIDRGVAATGDYDAGASPTAVGVYAIGNGAHQLIGGGGADTLRGAGGNDDLRGGGGADVLLGGAGNDVLNGGAGGDTLIGGSGFDFANYVDAGQSVTVNLSGGAPQGGAAGDRIFEIEGLAGSAFADTLTGDGGANWLIGNAGDDILRGAAGSDLIAGGAGADTIDGGTGFDIADYSSSGAGVVVNLGTGTGSTGDAAGDLLTGIEQLIGSGFADNFTGGSGNDVLVGGAGADVLNGAGGNDTADYSASGNGVDVDLAAGTGVGGDAQGDQLSGIEVVIGSAFADIIAGDGGDNLLIGGAGADQLSGNGGNDRLVGGAGADLIDGGSGIDTADYAQSSVAVQVDLALGTGVGGDAQGDQLDGVENLIGSAFGDLLVGDASANGLSGGAGDDRLVGGAGADLLDGGLGTDIADYSASGGAITLNVATGVGTGDAAGDVLQSIEIVVGSAWSDTLIAGGSVRTLDGAGGDDALAGSANDERLIGGAGADVIDGGGGFDRADYSASAGPVQVDLQTGVGAGGDAQGDSLVNIEGLIGSVFGDDLTGDAGDNLLVGGAGGDQLNGGGGLDTADYSASQAAVTVSLTGAPATGGDAAGDALTNIERLVGSAYNDQLGGDGAANIFVGGAGADTIDGGGGSDTADYAASAQGVAINLTTNVHVGGDAAGDSLSAIENVGGSAFADQLTGNAAANWLIGGAGDDMLDGAAGIDTLDGGLGNDTYFADAPGDIVVEVANGGSDSVVTTAASFVLSANVEALTYVGSGNFTGTGTGGNEKFSSGVGDDTLYGLGGDDLFLSSLGADQYVGGTGRNTASYTQSLSAVTINLATNLNLGGSAQGDLLFDIQIVSLSNYADDATGSGAAETFFGRSGVDILRGMGGDDWLDGGAGADTLFGGLGDDTYVVDDANDQVIENANEGTDTVTTARASWTLSANVENLVADSQAPFTGTGNALDNRISGTIAADVLSGMDGDDTLIGGLGGDQLSGGNGSDTVSYAASRFAVAIDLGAGTAAGGEAQGDTLSSIENLVGSALGDTLTGGVGDNRLDGQAGNDLLKGGTGNDILICGAGNDNLDGGDGADTALMSGLRSDYLVQTQPDGSVVVTDLRSGAPDGTDQLANVEAIAFADLTLTLGGGGGPSGVTIIGTSGNDTISTSSAPAGQPKATINNDIIYGLGGNDTLDGGGGADTLYGGSGSDTYVVDNILDRAIEDSSPGIDDGGTDLVKSAVSFSLSAFVENLTLTGTTAIDGTGNSLANKLIGNAAVNALRGGSGNDTLQGIAGNDSLYGDAGNDTLDGGSGADTLFGGAGDDTYLIDNAGDVMSEQVAPGVDAGGVDIVKSSVATTLGQFIENLTLTGSAAIDGTGNELANKLVGNTGANVLHGGAGNDTIGGGAGNDILWGEAGLDTLTGSGGADTFMLFAPVAGNHDKIADFTRSQGDKIGLVGSDFGLVAGALDPSHLSTSGVATSAAGVGQLVYNPSTKMLMWDADGSGGAAGITLATFGSGTTLSASDFIIV